MQEAKDNIARKHEMEAGEIARQIAEDAATQVTQTAGHELSEVELAQAVGNFLNAYGSPNAIMRAANLLTATYEESHGASEEERKRAIQQHPISGE